jgi:hypothetical protein
MRVTCGTELDSSSSNRPGQQSDVEGSLRLTDFRLQRWRLSAGIATDDPTP